MTSQHNQTADMDNANLTDNMSLSMQSVSNPRRRWPRSSETWFHKCFQGITSKEYSSLNSSSIIWACLNCHSQNYSGVNPETYENYSCLNITNVDDTDHYDLSIDSLESMNLHQKSRKNEKTMSDLWKYWMSTAVVILESRLLYLIGRTIPNTKPKSSGHNKVSNPSLMSQCQATI